MGLSSRKSIPTDSRKRKYGERLPAAVPRLHTLGLNQLINLISTSDKIQLTPSSTSSLEVRVDFMEATTASGVITADTFKPDNQRTAFSTASVADILSAPASNRVRNAKLIVVRNTGATNPALNTVLCEVVNAAGAVDLFNVPLAVGEWLTWNETGVLFVYATDGSVKSSAGPGRFLRRNILTSGTSYTTGADCSKIKVTVIGGGGGGGGCTSVASAAAAAGGGGSGAKAEKTFDVSPSTAYTYAIGSGGAGNSGAAGSDGGSSTFAVGATTVTAPGGKGAPVATAATTLTARAGGDGGATATNGDHNKGGNPGTYGVVLIVAGPIVASGSGGSGVYGDGGLGLVAVGNGNAATGNGGGGGGAATGASTVRTGGAGSGGVIIVEEYA